MKAYIGTDVESGLVHSVIGTAAHVNDVTQALPRGGEAYTFGNAGYQGVTKRPESDAQAQWITAMRPGQRRALRDTGMRLGALIDEREHLTASICTKVEHPFHVIKNLFRHRKLRCKGLAKNTAQLFSLFGLANLVIAKKSLLALDVHGAS